MDALSPSVLRKIQAVANEKGISQDKVINDALAVYESVELESETITDEQLAALKKHPVVKAYLSFRAKKTAQDLGETGRGTRASSGGTKRWGNIPEAERQAKIDAHMKKMNEALEKARKKKAAGLSGAAPKEPKRSK